VAQRPCVMATKPSAASVLYASATVLWWTPSSRARHRTGGN